MIVLPFGPRDAKIVVVGEAPGRDEVMQGKPFVGASGKLLRQLMVQVGIDPSSVYYTNVLKIQPPLNDFGAYYEDRKRTKPKATLQAAYRELERELRSLHPTVILCAGGEALKAVAGKSGIKKWRGSILSTSFGKVLGTIHPAAVLREYGAHTILKFDLRRVFAESSTRYCNLPQYSFIVRPTLQDVRDYLSKCTVRVAFDIETIGDRSDPMGTRVRCLGLSNSPSTALCIPFMTDRGNDSKIIPLEHSQRPMHNYWTEEEEREILDRLDQLFLDERVEKVAQNAAFDITILESEFGFHIRGLVMDTMLAHHACYCEFPKGLDFLASIYTRTPYWSDYDFNSDDEVWRYNCTDCAVTYEVSTVLDKELRELGLEEFYKNQIHPSLFSVTRSQNRGVLVDETLRSSLREDAKAKRDDLKARVAAMVPVVRYDKKGKVKPFSATSPHQLKWLLYEQLKLPVQRDRKTKKPTTNKKALETLSTKFPQHKPLFDLLLPLSKIVKRLTTVLNAKLYNGRFYTSYDVGGTVTGRLSSRKTIWGFGANLQNIERGELRRIILPDPGCVLIKCDLSQADFRVVVWTAKILRLIEQYQRDNFWDVHKWNASANLFRIPIDQVTKEQRGLSKVTVHAGNYMTMEKTMAEVNKLPLAVAKQALESYRKGMPELKPWWDRVWNQLCQTRSLRTVLGRYRFFMDRLGEYQGELHRTAVAQEPQSVVGDIINRALTICDEILPRDVETRLQVHDEIVFNCPTEMVERVVPVIRRTMEYPISFPGVAYRMVIPAEISVGPNWYDQKVVEYK